MTVKVNPVDMNVTDAMVSAEGDTAFKVLVGTQSGGPYATSVATVPISSMTNNNGVYTVPFAQLAFSPALQNGVTYFAVCEAENAGGAGANSPEASFQVVSLPSAPTALSFT